MTSEITCSNEWTTIELIICFVCHSRRGRKGKCILIRHHLYFSIKDGNGEIVMKKEFKSPTVKWANMFFIHPNVINMYFHYFS